MHKGYHRKAAHLLTANVTLVRQFISFRNSRGGMALIDSMICVAILRNISRVINSTDGLGGYSPEVYPLLKERFEMADKLFTFCERSLATEGSGVPSIIHYFNDENSGKMLVSDISTDDGWMKERLDYYYPDKHL